MGSSAVAELGAFLTGAEARRMAAMLESGESLNRALNEVGQSRREDAKALMTNAGLGNRNPDLTIAVLKGISGAKSVARELTPVWTMPGNEAEIGHLTSQFHKLVEGARISVTAVTYNFSNKSWMWQVLKEASERPGVRVVVYVDRDKANPGSVKAQMPKATVYRSGVLPNGEKIVSHAKFVIIDHSIMLLTSANFSYNAENQNVEFGILIRDSRLAESVEEVMADKRGTLYEEVV